MQDVGRNDHGVPVLRQLAEQIDDPSAMAADLRTSGFILLNWNEPELAIASFDRAINLINASALAPEVKHQQHLQHLASGVIVAQAVGNLDEAQTKADEYQKEAESGGNPFQVKVANALQGIVAHGKGEFDSAIALLEDSDPRNTYYQYILAQAYAAKGEVKSARSTLEKIAELRRVSDMGYVLFRKPAQALLAQLGQT